jgi:hypothetical protein
MIDGVADAPIDGNGLTVISTVAIAVQPFTSVPVTVYVVFANGFTTTGLPGIVPGSQLYDDAPDPVSVTGLPAHTVVKSAEALTAGGELTVTVTIALFVHPFTSVPVTV